MNRILHRVTDIARWIALIAGFFLLWFLVVPRLDAKFGQWWVLALISVFAVLTNSGRLVLTRFAKVSRKRRRAS